MSRAIRKALEALTGAPSVPDGPAGVPPIPSGRGLPPPTPTRNLPPPPDVPPVRNLPGPTAPDAPTPPAGRSGWGTAARVGAALAAGGGVLGALGALSPESKGPPIPPPGGPQPPAPPTPASPPIDPKTATREELLAAGYRDYGSGYVPPGSNAMGVPDHWRRKMFLKQQANRYRHDFAKNPDQYNDMVAAYDQAGPNASHSARAVATRALTDHLDAQGAAQRGINVDNAANQTNMARQMGVPRGYIMAMQDVQRHAARGDIASASAAAAMYGQVYGQSFLYAAKNMTDQHAASEKAKAEIAGQKPPPQTVAQSVNKNMAEIQAMPPGPARKAAIEQFYSAGASGDPKAAKAGVENHYQTIVKDMATRLGNLSPEETSELQQVAGHMNYQQFLKYSGAVDTPDTQKHYQRIFNKNATWAQANEQLGPLGTLRDYAVPDWLFPGWK